jgi:hypothetical protein
MDLSEILDMKDNTSCAFYCMMGIVQLIYDKTCKVKCLKLYKNEPRKPWITTEILEVSDLINQL